MKRNTLSVPPLGPLQPQPGDPGTLDLPHYGIGFGGAVKRAFKKYARFDGRASRSEYWWFVLFANLVGFVLLILTTVLGLATSPDRGDTIGAAGIPFMILFLLFVLAMITPGLSILVRRLHDANFSGALAFLILIPSVGSLITMILAIMPTNVEGTRFDRPRDSVPPTTREVTKEQFGDVYFKLGGGESAGWGATYWKEFFEDNERPDMKYLVQEPLTPEHTRMMIVTDYQAKQHRLFFLTEDEEEGFFD